MQITLFQAFDTLDLQHVKTSSVPPVILRGLGTLSICGQEARTRGLTHMSVMVDSFLHQARMAAVLEHNLVMKGVVVTLWPCPVGEPCITGVCIAVAQLHESKCSSVVVLGDDSVLDAAKAVALLVTSLIQTLAGTDEHSVSRPRSPLIAVPTAIRTGSETIGVMMIIDAVTEFKKVLAHAILMPDMAIFDAVLTKGMPAHVTVMTGIDAPMHVVEAYSTLNATPFTDSLTIGAIAMISKSPLKTVDYGQDLAVRESMLSASCMARMAFSNTGLGLCHAMAHQPGATSHIPHGQVNTMPFPTVMGFNRTVYHRHLNHIGRALANKKSGDRDAINAVSELVSEVGRIKRLPGTGTKPEQYSAWVHAALGDTCIRSNSYTATQAQIVDPYAAVGWCLQAG